MKEKKRKYKAVVSSDWSECLSPNGPFDPISFSYPDLGTDLSTVFKSYTGNRISLAEATNKIQAILPSPITEEQMDAYLDECFKTYRRVPELIEWCLSKDILFMINSTGTQGYFQRVFKKGLLPRLPMLSAHPMIRYPESDSDPRFWYDIFEIQDKARNTEAVIHSLGIPPEKTILVGDSGGDGPHFEWGASVGAFLIGSMTKCSLKAYCEKRGIVIKRYFGLSYSRKEEIRNPEKEMKVDFLELSSVIESVLAM